MGDKVKVEDVTGADISDVFEVTGMDIKRRTSGEGTTLHLANRPRRLTERLSEIERDRDTLNAHMQGATNINGESFSDNADQDHPLNNDIYIPEDVVSINKVRLAFKRPSFRGYVQNTDHSHSFTLDDHTHEISFIPEHTHSLDLSDHTHDFPNTFDARINYMEQFSTGYYDTADGTYHTHDFPRGDLFGEGAPAQDVVMDWVEGTTTAGSSDIKGQTGDINVLSTTATSEGGGGTSTTTKNSGAPTYGIFEPDSEPDIDVDVYVDADGDFQNNTPVETITDLGVGQEVTDEIELKNDLDDPLTGTYHSIELVPTGRCRLQADVFKKVFIESTV